MDESLSWQQHYLEYGFCCLRALLPRSACAEALDEARRLVEDHRALEQWSVDRPGQRYAVYYVGEAPAIDALSDHPRVTEVLEEFFGDNGFHHGPTDRHDPARRRFALWVNPYDPEARQRLHRLGHIDSGDPLRGVAYQIALASTSPYSGNTTFFPGSHRALLDWLADHPDPSWPGGTYPEVPRPAAPWEFVAGPGDLVIVHHLLFHSANPSHASDRSPRIAVRVEAFPKRPPSIQAPTSLFERSLVR